MATLFSGRAEELHETQQTLFAEAESDKNVLVIHGEPGIGKTAFMRELCDRRRASFGDTVMVTAYMKQWAGVLVDIAKRLGVDVPNKSTAAEIQHLIVECAVERPVLLGLDNVGHIRDDLLGFMEEWLSARSSKCVITTSEAICDLPDNCTTYLLNGIGPHEHFAIKALLGDELSARIEEAGLWDELAALGGNPQKLVYLRWRAPATHEIVECIRGLCDGSGSRHVPTNLDSLLARSEVPLDHFLATGLIRVPEFDAGLLAHLWDELALGSTERFSASLKLLVDEKLLEGIDHDRWRVSASLHVRLQSHLAQTFGSDRLNYIHYFIGEYYLRRFTQHKDDDYPVRDLENYVYHMIRFGNLESAFAYVFDSDELEAARNRGFSVDLEQLLVHFDEQLAVMLREDVDAEAKVSRTVMAARVKIELARIYKDLSKHALCITTMQMASKLLDSVPAERREDHHVDELETQADHFLGIAYSQMGEPTACIETYVRSLKHAKRAGGFSAMDALSMGYLAYELKFFDMTESARIAETAVDIARETGCKFTLSKNLCTCGQILSFVGDIETAVKRFEEASTLCKQAPEDRRELGRVLVNSAVPYISLGDFAEALKRLGESAEVLGESGDRRRKYMGVAYQGIAHFRFVDPVAGILSLRKAIEEHTRIGARRERAYEIWTLRWMMEYGWDGVASLGDDHEWPVTLREWESTIQGEDVQIFRSFWESHYLPTLLSPPPSPEKISA